MFSGLDFLSITQKAAISVYPSVGKKDKYLADDLATESMRKNLNLMPIDARIVIGEGEMDEAPMLYIGEKLGTGGFSVDIAVDPLEGTNLAAKNQNNAITVMAVTPKDGLFHAPDIYMKKIASGKKFAEYLDVRKSLGDNLETILQSYKGKERPSLCVAMLDRDRHSSAMKEVVELGCRLLLLSDGDILPAIFTGIENTGIDLLYGTGAAPEGVISAAALKVLGGGFQGIFLPETPDQIKRCEEMGIRNPSQDVFSLNQLVSAKEIQVVMSAVTDGMIGSGVKKNPCGTYSVESLKLSTFEPCIQKITADFHFYE